jgi:hypothetical protein
MRVIDHPTPQTLVVGSAAGGLYAYTVTGWELSRDEYGGDDIRLITVTPACRTAQLTRLPPGRRWEEVRLTDPLPVQETREVPLRGFDVDGARGYYGFDRESVTFFVREG